MTYLILLLSLIGRALDSFRTSGMATRPAALRERHSQKLEYEDYEEWA